MNIFIFVKIYSCNIVYSDERGVTSRVVVVAKKRNPKFSGWQHATGKS